MCHSMQIKKLCNTFLAIMDEVLTISGNYSDESGPGEVRQVSFNTHIVSQLQKSYIILSHIECAYPLQKCSYILLFVSLLLHYIAT